MKYFVDTNIFLRVLVRENLNQFNECSLFLDLVKNREINAVTSDIVLSEVAWVLRSFYEQPKKKVLKSLKGINGFELKYINNFQTNIALNMFSKKNVKLIDCLIASIPEIYNKKWTVVSYDKDFDKLGIKRKEPKELA